MVVPENSDNSPRPDSPGRGATPVTAGQEETARQRVNRRWSEVLQETRVAQTGVQILFAFLLGVAFSSRFDQVVGVDRAIYVVTVLLAAASAGSLIAPVSIHRFVAGHQMKDEVVEITGRLMICGMLLLALTINCTLLLLLRLVLTSPWAELLAAAVLLWFVVCWYVIPMLLHRRSTARQAARSVGRPTGPSPGR